MNSSDTPALRIRDLTVDFQPRRGEPHRIVHGVDLTLPRGTTFGLVGESGSGKSMLSLAAMGLLSRNRQMRVGGSVQLGGDELLGCTPRRLAEIRGRRIAMVFQDPMASLNPAYTIGNQVAEPLRRHLGMTRRAARSRAIELLKMVEIPAAEKRLSAYPHEFSGGMRQRVMLAIALACDPLVLLADEPTTALDVTVQAQILDLLHRLTAERGLATIFITHDLAVVADIADRVGVMFAGRIVEEAESVALFERLEHPYTEALLASNPDFGDVHEAAAARRSRPAQTGCAYAPRCPHVVDACGAAVDLRPSERDGADHLVRCVRASSLHLCSASDLDTATLPTMDTALQEVSE